MKTLIGIAVLALCAGCDDIDDNTADMGTGTLTDLKTGVVYDCTDLELYSSNRVVCKYAGGTITLYNDFSVTDWKDDE